MGHKPWDLPWRRAERRRGKQRWQAEADESRTACGGVLIVDGRDSACRLEAGHMGYCWDGQTSWGRQGKQAQNDGTTPSQP